MVTTLEDIVNEEFPDEEEIEEEQEEEDNELPLFTDEILSNEEDIELLDDSNIHNDDFEQNR